MSTVSLQGYSDGRLGVDVANFWPFSAGLCVPVHPVRIERRNFPSCGDEPLLLRPGDSTFLCRTQFCDPSGMRVSRAKQYAIGDSGKHIFHRH